MKPVARAVALALGLAIVGLVIASLAIRAHLPSAAIAPLIVVAAHPIVDRVALRVLGIDGPRIAWQSTWFWTVMLVVGPYYGAIDGFNGRANRTFGFGGPWLPYDVTPLGWIVFAAIATLPAVAACFVRLRRATLVVAWLGIGAATTLTILASKKALTAPTAERWRTTLTPVATFPPGAARPLVATSGGFTSARYCSERMCRFHLAPASAPGTFGTSDISEVGFPSPRVMFVVGERATVTVSRDVNAGLLLADDGEGQRVWIRQADFEEVYDARSLYATFAVPWTMIGCAAAGVVLAALAFRGRRRTKRLFDVDHPWRRAQLGADGFVRFDDGTLPAVAPPGTKADDAAVVVIAETPRASFREAGATTVTKLMRVDELRAREDAARAADRAFAVSAAILPAAPLVAAAMLGLVR